MTHGPTHSSEGEPLCRGSDWTEPAWVPSQLTEPRDVGRCSWLENVTSYDEYDEPYEDHIAHEITYRVCPDGSAEICHAIETPWGSGDWSESTLDRLSPGTWKINYFSSWPAGFGSRSGTRIIRLEDL